MGSREYLHKLLAARTGALPALMAEGERRAAVLAQVRARLPAELAATVHSAAVDGHCLRLGVPSSAWAARLRFMAPRLCRDLADLSAGSVDTVDVYVAMAPDERRSVPTPAPIPLSDASREHLESVAAATDNPRLAAALRALSRRNAD